MEMSNSPSRELGSPGARAQVSDLLQRYPDVSAAETAEILRFLKKGPALEVALLTTDVEIRRQLDRFRAAHASHFRLGVRDYLIAAVIVAVLIAVGILLWDAGIK